MIRAIRNVPREGRIIFFTCFFATAAYIGVFHHDKFEVEHKVNPNLMTHFEKGQPA